MVKIIRDKSVRYIHPINIKYAVEVGDEYMIYMNSNKNQLTKNEFDPEKAGLVKCSDHHFNAEYIDAVEVSKTRDFFTVFLTYESAGRIFTDLGALKGIVEGFYEVNRIDGSIIYINSSRIDTTDKPFTTAIMKITSGAIISEVPVEVGDQIITCTITLDCGKKFKFDASEAVQLLSHYEEKPKKKKSSDAPE